MRPLRRDEVMTRVAYELAREALRRRIIAEKGRRRVAVGGHCSVLFESRDTVLYQVHEMLRAEASWERPGAPEAELAAYGPLVPGNGELSATLMFEFETAAERAERLHGLVGIDRHAWLVVGDTAPLLAAFDGRQIGEGSVSAVQYLRWRLDEARRRLLATEGTVVRIVVDHPRYRAQAVLGEQTRRAIASDPD